MLKLLAEWKSGRPVVRNTDTELDSKITGAIKTQMQRVAEQAAAIAEERAAAAQARQQAAVLTAKLEAAERRATEADARTTKADAAARERIHLCGGTLFLLKALDPAL